MTGAPESGMDGGAAEEREKARLEFVVTPIDMHKN